MFASDLVRALAEMGVAQRVVLLRASAEPRVDLDAPVAVVGSNGRLDFGALGGLRSTLGWKPDVVQAHGGDALKHAVVAALGRRIPVVYRRIGSTHPLVMGRLRRAAYGALMRRAARIVAVAEAVRRDTIERFRVSPSLVETVPNAVDLRRLEPWPDAGRARADLGLEVDAPVVLSLGALTWEKDPVAALAAGSAALAGLPKGIHLMAGEGPLRPRVEAEIDRRGMRHRVRMLGGREDVSRLLAASDVLLLASSTEGMPGVAIEAGMAGMPVAGYAVGGMDEIVVDGETGRLVGPGDLRGLVRGLTDLLAHELTRRRMGEAARLRCRRLFDMRAVAPRYLRVYEAAAALRPERVR